MGLWKELIEILKLYIEMHMEQGTLLECEIDLWVTNEGASILLTPKEKTNKQKYHKRGNY